jgi:hypothetical protein
MEARRKGDSMNDTALALSAELRDELASNEPNELRFSYAKAMARSAAHARYAMQFDYEPTLAMKLGTAAHSLILSGPRLAVYPGKVRRGKDWDAFKADNLDALIVSASELKRAEGMAASVKSDPVASRVLYQPGMLYEQTIHWSFRGRKFRSTPDARGLFHLVDLKTTRDASLERFGYDAIKQAYHAQLYGYSKAMEAENGFVPKDVYIVAVESRPPYACSVHQLTLRALEAGGRLMTDWVDRIIQCERSGVWPGYSASPVDLDVPFDVDVDLEWGDEDSDDKEEED